MSASDSRERSAPAARLDGLARRAALALVWERIWPPLAWTGSLVALFFAVSWGGFWFAAPAPLRGLALVLFALALGFALAPLARLRWPSRAEALARLDAEAPRAHRPASGFVDNLANATGDATTAALWALHRARLASEIETLAPSKPSPRMAWRDPRALRFAALLLALASGLYAGSERYARLVAAFDFRASSAPSAAARVDAWIDPPAYTARPPLLLKTIAQQKPERVIAPEDSVLVVRSAPGEIETRIEGALTPAPVATAAASDKTIEERRFVLHGDAKATLARGGSAFAAFDIRATPKGAPTIALIDPPQSNASGSLTLHYSVADAYGVASAGASFALPGSGASPTRSLAEPPKLALSLPADPRGVGEARTTTDLSEHPWAGAEVTMTLQAANLAGVVGASAPVAIKLPQREFTKPLARALIEQRRDLILDPDHDRPRLKRALDALLLAPEEFDTPPSVYLGLRSAKTMLARATGDKDLLEVAAWLWAMALQIENGDASQALRDLRAAEQKLRDALRRGAGDDEIKALTKELRESAERYLNGLDRQNAEASPEDQPLDMQDLESLLDRMEDTARNGARDEAEAMLDDLQNLFENLQSARGSPSPAEKEMRKQLGELDRLMRDQQKLRDDTFRRDQQERARRASPDAQNPPEADDKSQPSLEQRQQDLKDRLAELQRRMKGLGAKPEKGFGDAEGAMGEAEGDLKDDSAPPSGGPPGARGRTRKGDAVDAQGRALQALREGADGLQKQMQGEGKNGQGGANRVGRGEGQRRDGDPLGRGPHGSRGASEGQLHEGPAAAERARRVLQELRRRLADPNRPGEERDYLNRLLERE